MPYPQVPLSDKGETLAVIGPVTLTTGEIERRIMALPALTRMQLQDQKRRREFVEREVQLEVLAQEAWRRGLQNDPQVIQQLKRVLTQRLIQDEMTKVSADIVVTDGDALKAYEERKSEFVKPPRVRLAQIVRYVETERERKAAQKLLGRVRSEVTAKEQNNDVRAFANAVRGYSQDEATRKLGGDLQFLTREELTERYGEQVASEMFDDASVGDLSIADAPDAVVLFKKTGVRRGVNRTFDQVRSQVRGQLAQQRRVEAFEAFVDKLRADGNVEVYLERATAITLPPAGTARPLGSQPDQ